ncbi:MAG: glycosyltransferase [Pirellulaceae bacterium]|nr:glycosyltransferase [Pirellulaceae bacterium]
MSVIIPTFNRKGLLRQSLESLAGQVRDAELSYEVLVCDDGSSDGTPEMCRSLAGKYPVALKFVAGRHSGGPSGPRNEGTAAALGRVALYLDDDVVAARDLVLRHARFHRQNSEPHIGAVGRLVTPESERDNAMAIFSEFPYDELAAHPRPGYLFFWTGNVSLKREFMLEKGLFRPDPSLYPIEDMDCGYRLCRNGLEIRYLGEACGDHYPTVKPERVADRGWRTGMAQFALWNMIGDPEIPRRFGVLIPETGFPRYAELAFKRLLFRVVDQPLTHAALRLLGATSGKRTRWSDLYYYLIFRRRMIAGYSFAKKRHKAGQAPAPVPVPSFTKAGIQS